MPLNNVMIVLLLHCLPDQDTGRWTERWRDREKQRWRDTEILRWGDKERRRIRHLDGLRNRDMWSER